MASLREIKDRIGSVKSTLKITSAMKLVASSKLRKAQKAVENLRPYEEELNKILTALVQSSRPATLDGGSTPVTPPGGLSAADLRDSSSAIPSVEDGSGCPGRTVSTLGRVRGRGPLTESVGGMERSGSSAGQADAVRNEIAIVSISSNSSLCGGFNANVIKKTTELVRELEAQGAKVTVYSLGRKIAEAMKKAGYPSEDYSQFISHTSYARAVEIAQDIAKENDNVLLVYNHFVTTAKQVVVVENWISSDSKIGQEVKENEEYIVEPGTQEVLEKLAPQVTMLKFYAAVLDSAAAEHAARTIAMQTASDNAQDLLSELTLEYNKGRQQKITAEILDLIGGISE